MPRITNIEVARKNLPLRITLLILALVIAFTAFGYGISELLTTDPGWKEIEVNSTTLNCSEDFSLNYNLGAGQTDATTENKALITLYSTIAEKAYQLFNNDYASTELQNIRYVNEHINEAITVDPALHKALSAIVKAENRSIYLAPVYAEYSALFLSQSDVEAAQNDPARQPDTQAFISAAAGFANDPAMINLEIIDSQTVRLTVAQAYLDFAVEYGIENFLDFSWMKNAFIADYIADELIQAGYTNGYISSYDGFTRNLMNTDDKFALNLYHRVGTDVYLPAALEYTGGCSLVALRDFPVTDADRWHYYAFSDGKIASLMLDPATGTQKSAVSAMIGYSVSASCSEILLSIAPLFIADSLDTAAVNSLTGQGIYTVYPQDKAVYANDPAISLVLNADLGYTAKTVE
ncbi:MAG: hypothetical protein IJN60_01160 [Oscillospiraceae bacterium]|nr:hypothetical protein [Oscillospiraceae bacterium]